MTVGQTAWKTPTPVGRIRHWRPEATGLGASGDAESTSTRGEAPFSFVKDLGVWLTLAAFSPYLVKSIGIRIEHIVVYGLGIGGALRLMTSRFRRPTYAVPVIGFFGLAVVWSLLVTFVRVGNDSDTIRVVADADHYARPLMIVIALVAWIETDHRRWALASFRRICSLLLFILAMNAVIVAVSLFANVDSIIEPFRPDNVSSLNVADLAAQLGRYTGVFNLPFEAGVAYSLGLFAWAYLFLGRDASKPYAVAHLALALVVLGGLLPASKAFLLGGLPLFLVYWLAAGGAARLASVRTLLAVAASVVGITLIVASWSGSDFIEGQYREIVSGDSGLLSSLSAGRFGEGGAVSDPFRIAATEAPGTGLGLGLFRVLDSAYFMYFVHGGIMPLIAYVALLAWLAKVGMQHALVAREGRTLVLLAVFMAGAGFGAPVASVLRSSTVLWTMITLLLVGLSGRRQSRFGIDDNRALR